MTGTEHPLARIGRMGRGLPRWRAGRYSLSRLFLNFYLLAMGSFVAIAFFADLVISTAAKGVTDDYARRFMRGTIVMIEEDLFRYPRYLWPQRIRVLDAKFSYKLGIAERDSLALPLKQTQKLDAGDIAIDHEGEMMYHGLKGTSLVVVLGPLSPDRNPELEQRGIPIELRIRLLTWSLIGLCFAIALWFWVRPIWRDLEAIRQTARALGEGDFQARSPAANTTLFAPLADTLNGMAERVQHLIATHKELSSSISHELRTPIARMRFALEMLAETDEAEERERLRGMMNSDLDELDNLIDTSLTYARFEREAPTLQLSRIPLQKWLEEQVESLRILGRKLAIRTDFSALPPDLEVDLDRKAMPYAIKNLLRNAIKYAQSQILVSASQQGGRVFIHVDDDGIGIPEEERERVFTAFTRLDRSRDRSTGGYGLGLAITRRVLELHNGSASVQASPLGGARFSLCWPERG
ncbi:MAG: hypothetical protein RIR00_2710 [Pseudomonadota bacterium]|jgi:two-component system sensor histidine kinase RstB